MLELKVNTKATYNFNDGTEWHGKFTYNAVAFEGMLLIESEGKTQSFGPSVVKNFSFFDSTLGATRIFYSLRVDSRAINQAFNFFELIYEGQKISILGRNTAKMKTNMTLFATSNGLIRKKTVYKDFKKYILNHKDNKLLSFFKATILGFD